MMSEMIHSCVDEARREFERVIEQRVRSMLRHHIMGTGTDAFDLLKDAIHNIEDAFSQLHELTVDAFTWIALMWTHVRSHNYIKHIM